MADAGNSLELAAKPEDPQTIQPRPREDSQEFGISIRLPFSTPYIPPRGVQRRAGEELFEVFSEKAEDEPDILQLQAMRRTDGQARALYRLITLPIRSALRTGKFIPADGGEAEAEFAEQMLTLPYSGGGMETPIRTVVSQMLMAVFDGYSAFEQVLWRPRKGPLAGKWTLRKIAHRPSETISFITDDHGDFRGVRQRTVIHGKEIDQFIDHKSAVYFAVQEEERPYYGVSYFQSAFNHFDKKVKLYYIAHLSAQHRAVGSRIGKAPNGASQKERELFLQHMEDFGFAQAILLPKEFELEHQYPTANANFLDLINHHNSQMSKSVLAAFFDDSQGGGADHALVDFGKQSDSMFVMMLQALMDDMAALFNDKIIPKFIDWNFGTERYPEFKWGTFTNEQKDIIHTTFDKLAVAGQTLTVTHEFMRELEKYMADELGLEIDYEDIDAQERADKEKADMQAQEAGQFFGSSGGFPPKPPKPPQPPGDTRGGPPAQGQPAGPQPRPGSQPAEPVPFSQTTIEDEDVELAGNWNEELHPRDVIGRFSEKEGSGRKPKAAIKSGSFASGTTITNTTNTAGTGSSSNGSTNITITTNSSSGAEKPPKMPAEFKGWSKERLIAERERLGKLILRDPAGSSAEARRVVAINDALEVLRYRREKREEKKIEKRAAKVEKDEAGRQVSKTMLSDAEIQAHKNALSQTLKQIKHKGSSKGEGTPDDPIEVKGDIKKAAKLLAEGKSIRLDRVDEVGVLLKRIHKMVKKAQEKGKDAPTFNLCNVTVPGTNLFCAENKGVPRVRMPQLAGFARPGSVADSLPKKPDGGPDITDLFREELRKQDIKITKKTVQASFLKPTQDELDGAKVAKISKAMDKHGIKDFSLFVTRDGYIIDGHHRWASKIAVDVEDGKLGDLPQTVEMVDMDIGETIDFANVFAGAMGIEQKSIGKDAQNDATPDVTGESTEAEEQQKAIDALGSMLEAIFEGKLTLEEAKNRLAEEALALTHSGETVALAQWREEQHPRDTEGKFAEKPGVGLGKSVSRALDMDTEVYALPTGRGTAHFKLFKDGTAQYVNARMEATELKREVAERRIKARGFEKQEPGFKPARPRRPKGEALARGLAPKVPKKTAVADSDRVSRAAWEDASKFQPPKVDEARRLGRNLGRELRGLETEARVDQERRLQGTLGRETPFQSTPLQEQLKPPPDTPQQQAILRKSKTAQKVRREWPVGTRVTANTEKPTGVEGTVIRHVPGTNAQGGHLNVKWDTGTEGRHSPVALRRVGEPQTEAIQTGRQYRAWKPKDAAEWTQETPVTPEQESAIRSYTSSRRDHVNSSLRRRGTVSVKTQEEIAVLDSVLLPLPRDITAKRVVDRTHLPKGVKEGDTWQDDGFTSATLNPHVADQRRMSEALTDEPVHLQLRIPAGVKARYLGPWSRKSTGYEDELLLDRGIKWKVTKVERMPIDNRPVFVTMEAEAPRFESQTEALIAKSDLSNPDTPRTRAVSPQEWEALSAEGKERLESLQRDGGPPTGLDRNFDALTEAAYQATRSPWGGMTIDAHTGEPLHTNAEAYALTVKNGVDSVQVSPDANEEDFRKAMTMARERFANQLQMKQGYLGVFHDEDTGVIDIDPVLVVDNLHDVDTIGSYTHAVGGAYAFHDGNGYWPPYVEEKLGVQHQEAERYTPDEAKRYRGRLQELEDSRLQRTGGVASQGEASSAERTETGPTIAGRNNQGQDTNVTYPEPFEQARVAAYRPAVTGFQQNERVQQDMQASATALGTSDVLETMQVRGAPQKELQKMGGNPGTMGVHNTHVNENTRELEREVVFDEDLFKTRKTAVIGHAREAQDEGWLVESHSHGVQDMVVFHELGHEITQDVEADSDQIDPSVWRDEVMVPLANAMDVDPIPEVEPGESVRTLSAEWQVQNADTIMEEVSEYGASQLDEMYAELWAEYVDNPSGARPPAKAFGEGVRKAHQRLNQMRADDPSLARASAEKRFDEVTNDTDTLLTSRPPTGADGKAQDDFWREPEEFNDIVYQAGSNIPILSREWSESEIEYVTQESERREREHPDPETIPLPFETIMRLDNISKRNKVIEPIKAYWSASVDEHLTIGQRTQTAGFEVFSQKDYKPIEGFEEPARTKVEAIIQPGTEYVPSDGSQIAVGRQSTWEVVGRKADGTWLAEIGPPDREEEQSGLEEEAEQFEEDQKSEIPEDITPPRPQDSEPEKPSNHQVAEAVAAIRAADKERHNEQVMKALEQLEKLEKSNDRVMVSVNAINLFDSPVSAADAIIGLGAVVNAKVPIGVVSVDRDETKLGLAAAWEEAEHPRDQRGRFAEKMEQDTLLRAVLDKPQVSGFTPEQTKMVQGVLDDTRAQTGNLTEGLSIRGASAEDMQKAAESLGMEKVYALHQSTTDGREIVFGPAVFDDTALMAEDRKPIGESDSSDVKESYEYKQAQEELAGVRMDKFMASSYFVPVKNLTMSQAAFVHEIGHDVVGQLATRMGDDRFEHDVVDPAVEAMDMDPPKRNEGWTYDDWLHSRYLDVGKKVSVYATTNMPEFTAELWTMYMDSPNGPPTPARVFGQKVREALKEFKNG